jgi:RecA/RadA recombinase
MKIKRRSKYKKIADEYVEETKKEIENPRVEFIGTGSTCLNLALSGLPDGGWARGRIHNIVGDKSSGKTLLALEEAFWFFKNIQNSKSKIFPKVKEPIICFDKGEGVMDFPVEKMYGQEFYNAVDWERSPHFEAMCRRFFRKVNTLKKGQSLLYIIDSWDSFKSAKSMEAFLKSVKDDVEIKGDYDMGLQKYASSKFFPNVCSIMDNNGADATLCIISQIRDKIGVLFGRKQYRAGGKALDFYTHQVIWIRELEKLDKIKLKEKRVYGIKSEALVDRSKVAKPFRTAQFTILFDYGLDDISSCLDYLYGSQKIKFNGKEFQTKNEVTKYIEDKNLESLLVSETAKKWNKVEKAFEKEVESRKRRF